MISNTLLMLFTKIAHRICSFMLKYYTTQYYMYISPINNKKIRFFIIVRVKHRYYVCWYGFMKVAVTTIQNDNWV